MSGESGRLVSQSFIRSCPRVGGAARILLGALGAGVVFALITLPWTLTWYDVQPLNLVREGPAFWPRSSEVFVTREFQNGASGGTLLDRTVGFTSSWLGHDDLGRSLMFRILPALLISLGIGLMGAMMASIIGVGWGATAGLCGGAVDRVMMRVVDVLYGLPYILTVILLKIGLTKPLTALFAGHGKLAEIVILLTAIGGVSWLTMARVVRGQVLSLRSRAFIEAARSSGAGNFYLLRRHLVPNMLGPILVYAALVVPQAMLQEAFLSFLGLGIAPPVPSLGRLAADGVEAVNTFVGYWWLIVFPCGVLLCTLLALNLAVDALRDRYDPRSGSSIR